MNKPQQYTLRPEIKFIEETITHPKTDDYDSFSEFGYRVQPAGFWLSEYQFDHLFVSLEDKRDETISLLVQFMNDAIQWGAESYNPPRVILEHPGSKIDALADRILGVESKTK